MLYQPPTPQLFTSADSLVTKEVPRLCIALDALDKCGKTHYALFTAPEPITLFTNDTGTLHVMSKAIRAGRKISKVMELNYKIPDPSITKTAEIDKQEWALWRAEWARYKAGVYSLIDEPVANRTRTLVRDTETDIWTLCMLSHFGKTQKISQNLRTEANADYAKVFWDLYRGRPDLNMVLIHKLKKEYKPKSTGGENEWSGNYETSGMNQIGHMVDITLRAGWDSVRRSLYTEMNKPTRFGFDLVGKRWYGSESHFGMLGLELFPETILTPGIWGF